MMMMIDGNINLILIYKINNINKTDSDFLL